jgi:hypothetical protein
VLHRGNYNVPWRFSEAVGKLSDLFDQIIGKAKRFCLFMWLGHVTDLDFSQLIGPESPTLEATACGNYNPLQIRLFNPLDL